jgi:hypothetical protein
LAIYSLTGRRPATLSDRDEILFAPGTVFHVLNVMDVAGTHWLFLREVADSEGSGPSDDFVLNELMAIALEDLR